MHPHVEQPEYRGKWRMWAGKEYFIFKRQLAWWFKSRRYSKPSKDLKFQHTIIKHQSVLLRPLKNVDMYLQHNKITIQRLAAAKINGVVIRPGETFSIWKLVGRPTASRGYLEGLVLHNGKTDKAIGGGLCQLGNLLYWMALHSPLTIKERWRHGYDVFPDINRTIPFACGATLSYNYVDLQVQNNTGATFQLHLWLGENHLNGQLRCDQEPAFRYEIVEHDHRILQQWWGGFTRHNTIKRKVFRPSGEFVTEEVISENHAIMMYQPFLSGTSPTT